MSRLQVFSIVMLALMVAGLSYAFFPPFVTFYVLVAAVLGIGYLVYDMIRSHRDQYSLKGLQEFEERESVRRLIAETPKFDGETVVCTTCMSAYDAGSPACPQCSRRGKQST